MSTHGGDQSGARASYIVFFVLHPCHLCNCRAALTCPSLSLCVCVYHQASQYFITVSSIWIYLIISVVHSSGTALMALSSIIHSVQCATQPVPPLSISFTIQLHFLHHFRINLISFVTFSNVFWYAMHTHTHTHTHDVLKAFRQFAHRTYVYRNDAVGFFSIFLSFFRFWS